MAKKVKEEKAAKHTAIVTLRRADNSIIGGPVVREIDDINTFDRLDAEFTALVADPDHEATTYQLVGA